VMELKLCSGDFHDNLGMYKSAVVADPVKSPRVELDDGLGADIQTTILVVSFFSFQQFGGT
jgi:hypothetical protein